jgi:hypothetical protein
MYSGAKEIDCRPGTNFLHINCWKRPKWRLTNAIKRTVHDKNNNMKTDNRDSEKDLNANPNSELNTNRPLGREKFPESPASRENSEKREDPVKKEGRKKDDEIELLADDVKGTVSERGTGSNPNDTAGVSDIDRGMRRARRYRS